MVNFVVNFSTNPKDDNLLAQVVQNKNAPYPDGALLNLPYQNHISPYNS